MAPRTERRPSLRRALLAALAACAAQLAAPAVGAPPAAPPATGGTATPPPAPTPTTVLALSAGNSRGAYQAGIAYALLHDRYSRRANNEDVEPLALAGSSIGAMNAMIAAGEECAVHEGGFPTPENSLFWKVWSAFDWDALFPGNKTCQEYRKDHPEISATCTGEAPFDPGDALLTSNQTRIVSRLVLTEFNSMSFRPDCDLPVAISLLGSTAQPIDAKDSRLGPFEVRTSRRLFMLTANPKAPKAATPAPTTLWLAPLKLERSADPRNRPWWETLAAELRVLEVPHLVRDGGAAEIPLTSLIDVVTSAISQPPYLVTPPLVACDVGCSPVSTSAGICPEGKNACADHYYDAAVFDHAPLPAAILLKPKDARYVLIDLKEPQGDEAQAVELSKARGWAFVKEAVSDMISAVSDYQLQFISRLTSRLPAAEKPDVRRIERTLDLASDNVLGFGGFIDRRFRSHDYYAGIVEGMFWLESQHCGPNCGKAGLAKKVLDQYRKELLYWGELDPRSRADLRRSPGLTQVLLSTIKDRMCGEAIKPIECSTLGDYLENLKGDVTAAEIEQIRKAAVASHQAVARDRLTGKAFSKALQDAKFDDPEKDKTARENRFVNAHGYWLAETVRQVASRSSTIETAQAVEPPPAAAAFGFVEYGASVAAQKFKPGFQLGTSTIPDRIWGSGIIPGVEKALIPAVIATDVLGGGRVGWELLTYRLHGFPEWKLGTAGAIVQWLRYRNVSDKWVYGPSLAASYEIYNWWASEIGLRAWWHDWEVESGRGLAAELFVRPLWGRAEIAFGTSQFWCDWGCQREGMFLTVGIADFNGLLYWALRGFTGKDDTYKGLVSQVKSHIPYAP